MKVIPFKLPDGCVASYYPEMKSAGTALEPRPATQDTGHEIYSSQDPRIALELVGREIVLFRDGRMQIFRPGANSVATLLLASLGAVPVLLIGLVYQVARSPYVTNQNVTREQPVPFGHEYHVGGPGIDCRYCDTSVEKARFAGLPPTSGIVGRNNSDRIVRIDALRRPGAPRPALTDTSVSTCGGDSVRPALDYVSELPRSNGTFDEVRHSPTTARAAILLVTLVLLANRFWRLDSHAIEIRN